MRRMIWKSLIFLSENQYFHLRLILWPPFLELDSHQMIISGLGQKTKCSSRKAASPEISSEILTGFSRTTISFFVSQRIHERLSGFLRRKYTLFTVQTRWLKTKCYRNSVCVGENTPMKIKIQVCALPETSAGKVRTRGKWTLPFWLCARVSLGKIWCAVP